MLTSWFALKEKQFHQQGYAQVFQADIEEYFYQFRWKRKKPSFYTEQVNDIAALTANQYFDFKTIQIQTDTTTQLADIDLTELF